MRKYFKHVLTVCVSKEDLFVPRAQQQGTNEPIRQYNSIITVIELLALFYLANNVNLMNSPEFAESGRRPLQGNSSKLKKIFD